MFVKEHMVSAQKLLVIKSYLFWFFLDQSKQFDCIQEVY